jgi:hypothetical protein
VGFFLLVLAIGIVVYAFVRAKARRHFARQAGALRDVAAGPTDTPPSWVTNKDRIQEVFYAMTSLAARKGMPESYVVASFNHADTFQVIMEVAGKMEERGASFTEQQTAMAHVLSERWKRLDEDRKHFFTETILKRKAGH